MNSISTSLPVARRIPEPPPSSERFLRDLSTSPTSPTPPEAWPPLAFCIEGDTSRIARLPAVRSLVASAEGVASGDDGERLSFGERGAASLAYSLPASFRLAGLVGRRLRVTLLEEFSSGGGTGQTLTVSGDDGKVWLVARHGAVRDVAHAFGRSVLRTALSQRAGGPLVVGTRALQWLVAPGERVHVAHGDARLVVHFVARSQTGAAAYVIADESLSR